MRIRSLILTLALVAAAAPLAALADDGARVVRFKGSDSGPFTTSLVSENPLVVFTQDVATGKANRGIGRYRLVASEYVNLDTLEVTGGQFTMTARRGSISGTYSGSAARTSDQNVITYHVTGPITGGTGRYEGAGGGIVFDGVADLATGQLSDQVRGVLVLPPRGGDDDDED
jgi:hypothetical protein